MAEDFQKAYEAMRSALVTCLTKTTRGITALRETFEEGEEENAKRPCSDFFGIDSFYLKKCVAIRI